MTPTRIVSIVGAAVLSLAAAPPGEPGDRQWTWPVDSGQAGAAAGFDAPAEPWLPGHRGVDLAAQDGSEVRASGAGLVTYAGRIAGVGVVAVTHGELRTTYQPVDPSVSAGRRVAAGEPVGTLAAAGSHCAPEACLHWGLLRGDTYLDPLDLVRPAAGPRLLPLGPQALVPAESTAMREPLPTVHQAARGALAGLTAG